jgi:hypothetical protein
LVDIKSVGGSVDVRPSTSRDLAILRVALPERECELGH